MLSGTEHGSLRCHGRCRTFSLLVVCRLNIVEHQVDWLCADRFECCGTSSLSVVCRLNDAGNRVCWLCVDLMLYNIVSRAQIECCRPSSSLVVCRLTVVESVHLFSNLNYYFFEHFETGNNFLDSNIGAN